MDYHNGVTYLLSIRVNHHLSVIDYSPHREKQLGFLLTHDFLVVIKR